MKLNIRKQTERGVTRWVLDYCPEGGKRVRRFFKCKYDADIAAGEQKALQRRAGEAWLALDNGERADLITGYERVRKLDLSLNQILDQWEAGTAKDNGTTAPGVTIREAGEAWVAHLELKGSRPAHTGNCGRWVRRFAAGREEMPVAKFTLADVQAWLKPYKQVTYNSYRDSARGFFSFCHDQGFHPKFICDSKRLPKQKVDFKTPSKFTPEQMEKALRFICTDKPELLGYFVLGTFVGIRPEECDRITWGDIDLDRGLIHLQATQTKVRRPRLMHLHPTALAWLKVARDWDCCIGAQLIKKQAKMATLRDHSGLEGTGPTISCATPSGPTMSS